MPHGAITLTRCRRCGHMTPAFQPECWECGAEVPQGCSCDVCKARRREEAQAQADAEGRPVLDYVI